MDFARGYGDNPVKSRIQPISLDFGDRYLQGSFHHYLKSLGYGSSRERMAIRNLLCKDPQPIETEGFLRFNSQHGEKRVSLVVDPAASDSSVLAVVEAEAVA